MQKKEIKPQPGFQESFLSSNADICIGGGAAGAGKTWAELVEPLRHKDNALFTAIIFRRTTVQITNPGSMWEKSEALYPYFSAASNSQKLRWQFPSGAVVKFSHLEHEKTVFEHQGSEYCLIIFDELTHFTKKQFIYMLSRNRSMCGVKPYIRGTCNPDPDSFLAELIEWWIDQEERLPNEELNPNYGFPIPDRAGVIRYFLVDNDEYVWGDTKQEVIAKCPHIFDNPKFGEINHDEFIKSITFIPGSIFENKALLKENPAYLGNLMAQDEEEKARLLDGNWKISVRKECLFSAICVTNMFSNAYPSNTNQRYITVDAARFGEDFCTIWIWYGWKVIKLLVLTKCDAQEAVDVIEKERIRYNITKGKVIVDQDGVGGGVVKLGRYIGFSGGNPAMIEPGTFIKENYENLKTQFYYRFSERVNNDEVAMPLSNDNVVIDGYFGVKMKYKGKIVDVRDLIRQDFRAIERRDIDHEGKKRINTKAEQKTKLGGRSPDFSDGASLRVYFEFVSGEIKTAGGGGNPNAGKSVLDMI
jgi:hypothetical protein